MRNEKLEIKKIKLFGKKILINLIIFYIILGMCMFMALTLDMGQLKNRLVYGALFIIGCIIVFGGIRLGMEFSVGNTQFVIGQIEEIGEVRAPITGRVKWRELTIKTGEGQVKLKCLSLNKSEIEAMKDDNKMRLWKYTNQSKTLYHIKDL